MIAGLNGLLFGYDFSKVQVSGVLTLLCAAISRTVFAFLLYLTSVQRNGATVASQTGYIVPLVATGLGVLLLHEHVTPAMLVGMVLIFLGLAIFDRGRRGRWNKWWLFVPGSSFLTHLQHHDTISPGY